MITRCFPQMMPSPLLRGRDPKQVHLFKVLLLQGNHHPRIRSGNLLPSSPHDVLHTNPNNNTNDEIPNLQRPQLQPQLPRPPLQLPLPFCQINNEPPSLVYLPKSSSLSTLPERNPWVSLSNKPFTPHSQVTARPNIRINFGASHLISRTLKIRPFETGC